MKKWCAAYQTKGWKGDRCYWLEYGQRLGVPAFIDFPASLLSRYPY